MKHLFAAALVALLAAGPALAQQNNCRPYDEYRSAIETQGGERLFIQGPSAVYGPRGIARSEVYINPEGQSLSYMFVIESPEGDIMCLGDFIPEFEFVPYQSEPTVPEGDPT